MANQFRNESKENLLLLLEEWEKICCYYLLIKRNDVPQEYADLYGPKNVVDDGCGDDNDNDEVDEENEEVFEAEKILGICYGDSKEIIKINVNYILRY